MREAAKALGVLVLSAVMFVGCASEETGGDGASPESEEEDSDSGKEARFKIGRGSSCLQMPDAGEGQVRFFVTIKNVGKAAADFKQSIHPQWYSVNASGDGGWVDTPLNDIEPDPDANPSVKPGEHIRFREDLGADPGKLIVRCAVQLEGDSKLVKIPVLR